MISAEQLHSLIHAEPWETRYLLETFTRIEGDGEWRFRGVSDEGLLRFANGEGDQAWIDPVEFQPIEDLVAAEIELLPICRRLGYRAVERNVIDADSISRRYHFLLRRRNGQEVAITLAPEEAIHVSKFADDITDQIEYIRELRNYE